MEHERIRVKFPVAVLVHAIKSNGFEPLPDGIVMYMAGKTMLDLTTFPFTGDEYQLRLPTMIPSETEIEITKGVFLCATIACI